MCGPHGGGTLVPFESFIQSQCKISRVPFGLKEAIQVCYLAAYLRNNASKICQSYNIKSLVLLTESDIIWLLIFKYSLNININTYPC